jgi:hypothetical protein
MGCGSSAGVHAAQGLSSPEGKRRYEAAQLKFKQKEADDFQRKFGFAPNVQIPGQMPQMGMPGQMPMMGMQQPMVGVPGQMPMMGMQQPMVGMPGQMPMMGMQQPMMGIPGEIPMMGMQQPMMGFSGQMPMPMFANGTEPITPGQQPYMAPDAYQPDIVEVYGTEQVHYEQDLQAKPRELEDQPQEFQQQPTEQPQYVF